MKAVSIGFYMLHIGLITALSVKVLEVGLSIPLAAALVLNGAMAVYWGRAFLGGR